MNQQFLERGNFGGTSSGGKTFNLCYENVMISVFLTILDYIYLIILKFSG